MAGPTARPSGVSPQSAIGTSTPDRKWSRHPQVGLAAGSAVFAMIGIWSAWEGYSLGLYQFGTLEPGFFPFVFGVCLVVIALLSLGIDILHALRREPTVTPQDDDATGGSMRAFSYLVVGVGFGIAMNWIGFLPAALVGVFVLVRIVEQMPWRTSLLTAFGSAVAADLLFVRLLSVPLPAVPI